MPTTVTPSIVINESPVSFGDSVSFACVVPKGAHNPWISLNAYDDQGVLLYGEGGSPDHVFVLGGASSEWVGRGGGPAHLVAELGDLYWKGGHEYYTFYAKTDFEAV